jgi:hypothetical protein
MTDVSDGKSGMGPAALDDLIVREILRTQVSPRDVDRAIRFLAEASGGDARAYQALPRRMRRLVDLLIAA